MYQIIEAVQDPIRGVAVPWRNLPRFHQELVASGWVTPALEYPSYRAFWQACASAGGPASASAALATGTVEQA